MKLNPYLRFIFVLVLCVNIIIGLLEGPPDFQYPLLLILLIALEMSFVAYQMREGIKELRGEHLSSNVVRISAILFNLATIIGAIVFASISPEVGTLMLLGFAVYVLVIDSIVFFRFYRR